MDRYMTAIYIFSFKARKLSKTSKSSRHVIIIPVQLLQQLCCYLRTTEPQVKLGTGTN